MSVDSITGKMAVIPPKPAAAPAERSVKGAYAINDRIKIQPSKPDVVYLKSAEKVSPANKPPDDKDKTLEKKPASSIISHVVVSYNYQGKIRTKFLDSRNNVVYQIPSELVAKMEDQMLKPETSTDIKG